MFELTLSISMTKQKYLLNLQKKLIEEAGEQFGIIVCHNFSGRSCLAIATDDSKKEYLKAKVLNGILDIIISEYKYSYFKEQLLIDSSSLLIKPFLKAISIFDADSDFEIIKREIDLSGEVLIDSFFYFKLQGLRQRWEKTANVILKNGIANSESSMVQVIKYLTDSSENFTLVANVKVGEKRLQIKNYQGIMNFKNTEDGLAKFLTEIISLNPLKINLTKNFIENDQSKICELLSEIFGEKIYIQN